MSASAETLRNELLHEALRARAALDEAQKREHRAVVVFMDEALTDYWSWNRIGEALGITGTGARRYYERNRRLVRPV